MIFERIATGGCQSYLLGCSDTHAAIVIDPNQAQIDRYLGLAARRACASAMCSTPIPMPITSPPRAKWGATWAFRW